VHASSEILYNLSPDYQNVDPCTNFEELVCGGWRDRHDLRADQGDAFTGTIMAENSQLLLRHILEAPYPKSSQHSFFSPMQLTAVKKSADEENFDKLKAAYDACLDEDAIKKLGAAPLAQILNQVSQLFKQPNNYTKDAILFLAKNGVSALIATGIGPDDKDPDTVITQVSPPWSIGLPSKERYEDEKMVKKYESVLTEVLSTLFPDHSGEPFSTIVDFEKKLAAASPDTQEREDITVGVKSILDLVTIDQTQKTYNPYSLKDASNLTPQVELAAIIDELAPVKVERIIITSPKYQKELASILNDTPKGVLQSYFLWKVIQSFQSYIEADAVKPYKRFLNELQGKVCTVMLFINVRI
jgi:endothelin-converting enzyme